MAKYSETASLNSENHLQSINTLSGHIKLFKSLRTGILESLIQYCSLNSCKLPDLTVLSYRYIILEHYYKKSLLNFFDKIVDFNEFLAVADGKLGDGGFRYLHKNRNPSSNTEEN